MRKERGETMKKNDFKVLTIIVMLCITTLTCTHAHSVECGKNGVDCNHDCTLISSRNSEHAPF